MVHLARSINRRLVHVADVPGMCLQPLFTFASAHHFTCHSPEDQAILEAEYRRNSKPDKKARMEIVSRVALGEKEVQVYKPGFLHSSLGEGYA